MYPVALDTWMMLDPTDGGGSLGEVEIEREAEGSLPLPRSRIALRRGTSRWTGWTFVGSGTPQQDARDLIAESPMCATGKGSRGNVVKGHIMLVSTSEGDGTISGLEEGGL